MSAQTPGPRWRATVLTLFPAMFPGPLGQSLAGKALDAGLWALETVDIRAFARDKHGAVDDGAFGTVAAVHDFGAGNIIEVSRPDGGEAAMLPFTREVVTEVDVAGGRLVVAADAEAAGEGAAREDAAREDAAREDAARDDAE